MPSTFARPPGSMGSMMNNPNSGGNSMGRMMGGASMGSLAGMNGMGMAQRQQQQQPPSKSGLDKYESLL
jgi:hypothetical protein